MKALAISGGSTKIPMLAGAAITLLRDQNYTPKYIVGTSSGALLALPLAMGKFEKVEGLVKHFNLKAIWDRAPVTKKGKLTLNAILRGITGKESFGTQENLIFILKDIISEQDFEVYKAIEGYPTVFIGTVEFKTGRRKYINLKKASYQDFLRYSLASSSIPGFIEGVRDKEFYHKGEKITGIFYDGGARDHIGSHWLIENHGRKLSQIVSIYSRPEDYNIEDLEWEPKNILAPITRSLDIMLTEISKNDERLTDLLCEKYKIDNKKIYFPYVTSSMYEYSEEDLENWYDIGVEQAEKVFTL